MSENDRVILLFILTVGFWVLSLYAGVLLKECLVGIIANFVIAAFWYHLWRLGKWNKKI